MDRQNSDACKTQGLEALTRAASFAGTRPQPPTNQMDPPFRGDIGLRIGTDGTWFYRDSPIARPALVRLFSTLLRREPDRYVLVTPVEKVLVTVEDAPFAAVELAQKTTPAGLVLAFRTNANNWIDADWNHRLRFEADPGGGLKPYLLVRDELWARLARPLLYELAKLGEVRETREGRMFGVASGEEFFPMAPAEELEKP